MLLTAIRSESDRLLQGRVYEGEIISSGPGMFWFLCFDDLAQWWCHPLQLFVPFVRGDR